MGAVKAMARGSADLGPQTLFNEERGPSVLASFNTEGVLDALALGIMVLDAQLCAIFANGVARHRLALELRDIRGRPLADVLPDLQDLVSAARCVLQSGATRDFTLNAGPERSRGGGKPFDVRIAPLSKQTIGGYVLIEWGAGPPVSSRRNRQLK